MLAKTNYENIEKTQELMLLISDKLKDKPTFGSVVFNKVLYYIDNTAYLKLGKEISKFNYIKQDQGPTPSPDLFLSLREHLIASNKMELKEIEYFGKIKKVPTNKVTPDLTLFSANELDIIFSTITFFSDKNGESASNFSHQEMSWKFAKKGEELPFYTYLLSHDDVLKEDVDWASNHLENVHNH